MPDQVITRPIDGDAGLGDDDNSLKQMAQRLQANLDGKEDPGPPKKTLAERLKEQQSTEEGRTLKPAKAEEKPKETKKAEAGKEATDVPQLKTVSGLDTTKKDDDKDAGNSTTQEDTTVIEVGDDEVPDSIRKGSKPAEDFKKIKRALKQANAQYEETKKALEESNRQLAEFKGKPAGPSEDDLKAVADERDALKKEMDSIALERSPEFQKRYNSVIERAMNRAKSAVGESNADKIEGLINLPLRS